MKYLLVIALVALLFYIFYRRLRPYLRIVREFISSIQHLQQTVASSERGEGRQAERLVCCEVCGTWVPAHRAIRSRQGSVTHCSGCVEKKPIN